MNPSKPQQPPLADDQLGQNQGEGNVEAGRHYNKKTREFVKSGQVDEAAREATPQSREEADDLQRAENEGRSHAKEEDPALARGARRTRDDPDRAG